MTRPGNRCLVATVLTFAIFLVLSLGAYGRVARQTPAAPSRSEAYSYARIKGRQVALLNGMVDAQAQKSGVRENPAVAYGNLEQTQRSTFEAITHALSRSRLTDAQGGVLKPNALELVDSLNEIAGQIKGVGGDKQFRLYVTLIPQTQEILAKSREFFRDKDNTVFHKEYPINYRQRGKEPTLQISISRDGTHADIDVDYRSSKAPQALINGHLRAANSDVRIGKNYFGHVGRWFGLIRWWRILLDGDSGSSQESASTSTLSRPQLEIQPTPARGPAPTLTAEQIASAQEVSVAMNEFLTTWLVKRNRQRADDFLVKRPVACINADSDEENETVSGNIAIKEFALLLDAGLRAKAKPRSLDDAVSAIEAWDPELVFVDHPFKQLFSLRGMQRDDAAEYVCDSLKFAGDPNAYGDFFLTTFTLKLAKENGGGLELLWMKEDGKWQIISYDVLEP
ncbi:MAG: hypothetical protein ABI882_08755 [Acidobacteriota bacterium]